LPTSSLIRKYDSTFCTSGNIGTKRSQEKADALPKGKDGPLKYIGRGAKRSEVISTERSDRGAHTIDGEYIGGDGVVAVEVYKGIDPGYRHRSYKQAPSA